MDLLQSFHLVVSTSYRESHDRKWIGFVPPLEGFRAAATTSPVHDSGLR